MAVFFRVIGFPSDNYSYIVTMLQTLAAGNFIKSTYARLDIGTLKKPLILSLINQFVSSGGNFLIGVYLARNLSLAGFGLYGIGFGICMLYVGIGNAVILTQMIVNMPDKAAVDKEPYAANMLYGVLLMGGIVVALTVLCLFIGISIKPSYAQFVNPVLSISLACVLFLCNEFFTSYAYLKRKEGLALVVNVVTMLVLLIGFTILHEANIALTAEKGLLLYALGATFGSCIAYLVSPLRLRGNFRILLPNLLELWHQGRWALGGVMITWIQSQTYTYILAFLVGPIGVGQANAARIFISPFSFLLPAINKVAIPRLADLRIKNRRKMFRVSMLLTVGLSLLTVLYSMILLGSLGFVSKIVLGRYDPAIMALVWVWCLVLVIQMVRSGGGVLLQVQRKFKLLMLINIPSAIVTIFIAMLMIYWFNVIGAILGMVAGEAVLSVLIWKEIQRDRIYEQLDDD